MKKWIYAIVLLLVVAGSVGAWLYREQLIATTDIERRAVYHVRAQDLLVSVTEGGTLEAVNEVTIINEVQGQSQIITLVPEGSYVKRGDLLVELDSSDLEEKFVQQQISYQNALSSFTKAEEDRDIQKSRNESDIREAELALQFARTDLEKYRDGDWPQEKKLAESDNTIAEAELKRAQDRLTWTEKLQAQGYATRAELDADKLEVKRKELELARRRERLRLLEKYEYPQQILKLESELLKKQEEMVRVRARAKSALAQAEAEVSSRKATLELQKDKLENMEKQLSKTRIIAPQSGLVVYASSVGRRRGGTQIVEGALVRQRQELIKLPDISEMKVQVKVHESRRNQISPGQRAYVVIDAMPDRRFRGYVSKVSVLPDSQSSWLNPDLKVYTTDIIIEEDLPENVKPGLSARGEIIIKRLDNVQAVPIQAVSSRGDEQIVHRVVDAEVVVTPVEVGMFNEAYIQITSGLSPGDVVLLNPPMMEDSADHSGGVVEEEELESADTEPVAKDASQDEQAAEPEDVKVAANQQLDALLSKLPADRRESLRKRWESMDASEREQFIQRMRKLQAEEESP